MTLLWNGQGQELTGSNRKRKANSSSISNSVNCSDNNLVRNKQNLERRFRVLVLEPANLVVEQVSNFPSSKHLLPNIFQGFCAFAAGFGALCCHKNTPEFILALQTFPKQITFYTKLMLEEVTILTPRNCPQIPSSWPRVSLCSLLSVQKKSCCQSSGGAAHSHGRRAGWQQEEPLKNRPPKKKKKIKPISIK